MKKIILLTDKNNFFGQTRKPWVSIDTQQFIESFKQHDFQIEKFTFDEIANHASEFSNCIIIYTFSQKYFTRQIIKDVIFILSKNNLVIPSYELLLCHENKGFQELYKHKIGIRSLQAIYFSDKNSIQTVPLSFPVVLKSIDGSNGKGVYLVKDKAELNAILKKKFTDISLYDKMDIFRRTYFRKKKRYPEYPTYSNKTDVSEYKEYMTKNKPFILQEFIPNLEFDYRVLQLYDKFYVTKRYVRQNDFRASGAKKFDFNFQPDIKLLSFAKDIFNKMNQPVLSLDICEKDGKYFLLEFQALHFGINVFVKSKGFYQIIGNKLVFQARINSFERELAEAFVKYINQ
jgi:glutathione synthase/RimK-type ligase-like ATP-grasp enzyme